MKSFVRSLWISQIWRARYGFSALRVPGAGLSCFQNKTSLAERLLVSLRRVWFTVEQVGASLLCESHERGCASDLGTRWNSNSAAGSWFANRKGW